MKSLNFLKLISSLLLFFIVISCNNSKSNNNSKTKNTSTYTIYKKKEIEIPIPDNVYYYSFLNQVLITNDTTYLVRQKNRTDQQGLDILNLNSKKFIKNILFQNEGDNGVGKISSFYYINLDSILLLNRKSVLIADDSGYIKLRKPFINNPEKFFVTLVSNKTKSFIRKNTYYFCKASFSPPFKNDFYTTENLYAFNLKTFQGKDMPDTPYPKMYLDKCWSYYDADFQSTYNENKDELLFTFPIDDNIYRYSIANEKIIDTVKVRSDYKKTENKPVNCNKIRSFDEKKHNYTNFYYASLIYDKYKDLYYRIALLPVQNYNPKKEYSVFDRTFVISILDSELKKMGESDIFNTDHEYIYYDWFVTEEGLWISANNPKNKNFNENTLSYALFKVKK